MGTAGAGRGEGGRTGRGRGLASNGNPFKPGAGTRDGVRIRGRATLNPAAIQKAIGRGISSGDAIFSGGRGAFRGGRRNEIDVEGLDKLSVTGWKESKATSNQGGGIAELKEFLERKASTRRDVQPGEATGEPVRIVKVCKTHSPLATNIYSSFVPHWSALVTSQFFRTTTEVFERCRYRSWAALQLKVYMPC